MRLDIIESILDIEMGKLEHIAVKGLLTKKKVWTQCFSFMFSI